MNKRENVLVAARRVFGRDGYARASIDNIAAEARASTRTIYNHFDGKEALFSAAVQESASKIAATQVLAIEAHLTTTNPLETELRNLAKSWFTARRENKDHFAIVRQAMAEAPHLPKALIQVWMNAGPDASTNALSQRFEELSQRGVLCCDDYKRAANHFVLLTIGELSRQSFGETLDLTEEEIGATILAGVRAFLHGYLADDP